eukprot:gene9401-biopygen7894
MPRRAGTNLTGAAVEYDLIVHNVGKVVATDIRLDVRLLSAGAQQDALISALFAAPIDRSITGAFDLPADAEVQLGGMGILPGDKVDAMTVEGRVMFLPVMTVNLTYDWAGGSGQTARSFVIGIDRGADARLGAFRLDTSRMYDQLDFRRQPGRIERGAIDVTVYFVDNRGKILAGRGVARAHDHERGANAMRGAGSPVQRRAHRRRHGIVGGAVDEEIGLVERGDRSEIVIAVADQPTGDLGHEVP